MVTTTRASARGPTSFLIGSDSVEGVPVYDAHGKRIGKVERLMIDKLTGQIAYAILSLGGFLGIGEDHYPIPWSMLTCNEKPDGFQVDSTEEKLKNAPKIEQGENWPENSPVKIARPPQFLMKASPRSSKWGWCENGHVRATKFLNLVPIQYESQSPSAASIAAAIQTWANSRPPVFIRAPIPTRAAQDGRINDTKASDSANARARFGKCQSKSNRRGSTYVAAHELDDMPAKFFEGHAAAD